MKNWIEIEINVQPEYLELLSSFIFGLGAEGVYERDNDFIVYFEPKDWNYEKHQLLLYFLLNNIEGLSESAVKVAKIENENWNEAWKENFKTFHLTESIVITPEWENYHAADGETAIIISPKMAFGTGHHETTQLILILLQKFLQKGSSVLDAGTGSGILAIAAVKQGAGPVVAFDNDPLATENTLENCHLNSVSNKIECFTGQLSDVKDGPFDLVMANINRNVLLDLACEFEQYLKQDGRLILSGLLETDFDKVMARYAEFGWQLIEKEQRGEWIALILSHETK